MTAVLAVMIGRRLIETKHHVRLHRYRSLLVVGAFARDKAATLPFVSDNATYPNCVSRCEYDGRGR